MNMRTLALCLAAITLLLPMLSAGAHAAYTGAATYNVTLLKYEPSPAQPGDAMDVWIQVTNTGGQSLQPATLYVDASYPLSPAGASDSVVNIGRLGTSSYVARITVLVDSKAADGTYNLPVRVTDDGVSFVRANLPFTVRSGASTLTITSATTNPAQLAPGQPGMLTVTVRNTQGSLVRDATLSLGLDGTVFSPIGGATQQTLSSIAGGGVATYTFTIAADPKADSSIYRIPVSLNFTTNTGSQASEQDSIGVVVAAAPQVSLLVDQANVYSDGKEGTIVLKLVNKGLSQIKFAEVSLNDGTGYNVTSNSRTVYLGNIDSDDFQTAEYTLKPTATSFNLAATVTYSDALNAPYTQQVSLPITTQANPNKKSPVGIIVVVVIVLAIGIWWWRRSRKKR